MTTLKPGQLEVLRALRRAYPEANIAIVGAAALAFHLSMTWRSTADLDLVVTISASDLDTALSKLVGWKQHPRIEQRWEGPNGVLIDLVPAAPDALARRQLIWPKTGHVMNLGGVRLALAEAPTELAPDLAIAVASIPIIALLKMAAYLDRPTEREKDLKDLAHILDEYPPAGDDRFFTDDVLSTNLDESQARGFILGTQRRMIVDEQDRELVHSFLDRAVDGHGWNRFVANSPWRSDEEQLRLRVDAFRGAFVTDPFSRPEVASIPIVEPKRGRDDR
jgi:predicted nucleotidyltransferase